jgi:hypothetical protein
MSGIYDEDDFTCGRSFREEMEDKGWVHESDLPDEVHIIEHLNAIIGAVYKTGNIQTITDSLEEVCSQYNIKIPDCEPVIRKRLK